MRFQHFNLGV